jgi:hypothetical protein
VDNATQVAVTLMQHSRTLYRGRTLSLLDENVTRATWTSALQGYAELLRQEVSPDDVLMVFWSGHGVRDADAEQYYFLPANARYADIRARRFVDCLSFDELTLFADVPCRKVVVLDTCHSGAIQPSHQQAMKGALRALQDDLVLTLTASEGDQEAVDGRFTRQLLRGIQGAADARPAGDNDGVVRWSELVNYVRQSVTADSVGGSYQQFPTAGPLELVELADFPVATVEPSLTATRQP